MVRHAMLTLAVLVVAVVPVQAASTQGAGPGPVAGPIGAHSGNQHLGSHRLGNQHPGSHRPGNHPPFHRHAFNHQPFSPFWGTGFYAPPVWYMPDTYYEPAPVYESPVVYSQAVSPTVSIASAPPAMPTVIPYPTGRYELRGDGLTSPYQWVWIPNPPPAPPPAPAQGPPPSSTPQPPDPAASLRSRLYRWVDDQGVVHYTQGWDTVPERYRGQLKLAGAP